MHNEKPEYTPKCCGQDAKWVQQFVGLAYFYCEKCKNEVVPKAQTNNQYHGLSEFVDYNPGRPSTATTQPVSGTAQYPILPGDIWEIIAGKFEVAIVNVDLAKDVITYHLASDPVGSELKKDEGTFRSMYKYKRSAGTQGVNASNSLPLVIIIGSLWQHKVTGVIWEVTDINYNPKNPSNDIISCKEATSGYIHSVPRSWFVKYLN